MGAQGESIIREGLRELGRALDRVFYAILRVDPKQDQVLILQSLDRPEAVMHRMVWSEYLEQYGGLLTEQGKAQLRGRLSCPALLATPRGEKARFSLDVSYAKEGKTNWLDISAVVAWEGDDLLAYVLVRQSNEEHLLKSIIDLYVYNTCDYFIYLDAKNNSYRMFSGSTSGTPLPPEVCDDYATAIVDYARAFVVPEDQEMVIREMGLDRVLDQLEKHGVHSFYAGVIDPVRGYTRKQLTYRYYDREAQMVLLSRTDVTGVYLEERARKKELHTAQLQAQTDALTGLLNHRALEEQVARALAENSDPAALLFIDLDNFKQVNDSLGHLEGDMLLKQVAQVLEVQTRSGDIRGRVGGDEFVVFLPEIRGREQAMDCAQRICDALGRLSLPHNGSPSITCSIGIALSPENGRDYRSLAQTADRLAYRAKAQGKNRYSI